ncbi:MAG: hypothetical protein WBO55_16485 [Rhizobiaceae bacterium]
MKLSMILQIVLGVTALHVSAPVAFADEASNFLSSLAGEFKGRGKATLLSREKAEPVSCKVNNKYDGNSSALMVSGNCASTQGKSSVSGKLTHDGASVSGQFIGNVEGSTVTGSRGTISDGQLVISSNMVDNATGNLSRTRQVIRLKGAGFSSQFYTYDNASGKYELNGEMTFTKQ